MRSRQQIVLQERLVALRASITVLIGRLEIRPAALVGDLLEAAGTSFSKETDDAGQLLDRDLGIDLRRILQIGAARPASTAGISRSRAITACRRLRLRGEVAAHEHENAVWYAARIRCPDSSPTAGWFPAPAGRRESWPAPSRGRRIGARPDFALELVQHANALIDAGFGVVLELGIVLMESRRGALRRIEMEEIFVEETIEHGILGLHHAGGEQYESDTTHTTEYRWSGFDSSNRWTEWKHPTKPEPSLLDWLVAGNRRHRCPAQSHSARTCWRVFR